MGSLHTHTVIEVHVVGHHIDIGVEDIGLTDNLLEDVTNTSREDEHGDVVLMQLIKQLIESIPRTEVVVQCHVSLSQLWALWAVTALSDKAQVPAWDFPSRNNSSYSKHSTWLQLSQQLLVPYFSACTPHPANHKGSELLGDPLPTRTRGGHGSRAGGALWWLNPNPRKGDLYLLHCEAVCRSEKVSRASRHQLSTPCLPSGPGDMGSIGVIGEEGLGCTSASHPTP